MIRLNDAFQVQRRRHRFPQRALQLFDALQKQLPPSSVQEQQSRVAVLEEGDDIGRVPRELGRYGLLDVLDNPWRSYDAVTLFAEGEARYYEMVITLQPGVLFTLIIPDAPWLDPRLRLVLEVETDTGQEAVQ